MRRIEDVLQVIAFLHFEDMGEVASQAALADFAEGIARKRFAIDGLLPPLFIPVWPERRGLAMIQARWGDYAEREAALRALQAMFQLSRPTRYAALSEAWLARVPLHDLGLAAVAPSQRADRQEVVTIVVAEAGLPALGRDFAIERPFDGAKASIAREPSHGGDGYTMTGALASLLAPLRAPPTMPASPTMQ